MSLPTWSVLVPSIRWSSTLSLLKDAELAKLDPALVRAIQAPETDRISLELHAEVFARYASRAVVKEAWEAYRAIRYFRVTLLAYLGRHDAKAAEAEIQRLDYDSLRRLSLVTYSPAIEAAVVAKLGGTDVLQAAPLLGAARRGVGRGRDAPFVRAVEHAPELRRRGTARPLQSALREGRRESHWPAAGGDHAVVADEAGGRGSRAVGERGEVGCGAAGLDLARREVLRTEGTPVVRRVASPSPGASARPGNTSSS